MSFFNRRGSGASQQSSGRVSSGAGGADEDNSSPDTSLAFLSCDEGLGREVPGRNNLVPGRDMLACLNDRFADYIERNVRLERENQVLRNQLSTKDETLERATTQIQRTYETELANARQAVEVTLKENTRVDLEVTQLRRDYRESSERLTRKTAEADSQYRKLVALDSKFQDLTSENNKLGTARDVLTEENKELKTAVDRLRQEFQELQKKLDKESVEKTNLRNRLQQKEEELTFQTQRYDQEINELKSQQSQERQEVDGRLEQEYELKLRQSIQDLRAEYEERIRASKAKLDELHEQSIGDLKAQLERLQRSVASKSEEYTALSLRYDALVRQVTVLELERSTLAAKVQELNQQGSQDRSRYSERQEMLEANMDALMMEKGALRAKYEELMCAKLALDQEIGTYRMLMEEGEKRAGHSALTRASSAETLVVMMPTRSRSELLFTFPPCPGTTEQSTDEFEVKTTLSGDIQITMDDPHDLRFITLRNRSTKDIRISNWLLFQDGQAGASIQFPNDMTLSPESQVTVWSSDAPDAKHEPPTDLIMTNMRWNLSDRFKVQLQDASGKHRSICRVKRLSMSRRMRRPVASLTPRPGSSSVGQNV